MASYAVSNNNYNASLQALSTSYKTLLAYYALTGATTLRRIWMYEFEIGPLNVPVATDCTIQYDCSVLTAVGTWTAATPQKNDTGGGDAAALGTYQVNATAEPTVTAASSIFNIGLNQRSSQRWMARDKFSSLISAAVNAQGLACRALSTNYNLQAGWNAFVEE
jgi:hypothetical protein